MTNPDTLTEVVAIDGPAGAGKSSVAKRVAEALEYDFLDTGAMYRAVTWAALDRGVDLDEPDAVIAVAEVMELDLTKVDGNLRVCVDGTDVSDDIRTTHVTENIYRIDQMAQVRAILVDLQRGYAARGPIVAEGRDMGTVVFPNAQCKIFLDASLEERVRRRAEQLEQQGEPVDLDTLRAQIHTRDEKGRTRAVSPLRQAEDAVLLDTTGKTLDEVVDLIVTHARSVA
jgi:cytidylate kinase